MIEWLVFFAVHQHICVVAENKTAARIKAHALCMDQIVAVCQVTDDD